MKAVVYRLPDADRLLLAIHHLVVDGVSWRILLEDLASGYRQAARRPADHVPREDRFVPVVGPDLQSWPATARSRPERAYWERVTAADRPPIPGDERAADLHGDAVQPQRA